MITSSKQALRNFFLQQRKAISSKEKLKLDDLLLIQFQRLAFENVATVLSYWPMPRHNEPNTLLFSGFLRHAIPNLKIAYPISDFENNRMQAFAIDENTIYKTNKQGITEPQNGTIISSEEIDLVFVPMIVCDKQGYRVGYGKGFYDRFLAECKPDILKVGFSYFTPVEKIEDIHQFDIPLDYCITTDSVYEF